MSSFATALAKVPSVRILVVGDLMLDQYFLGHVARISPEAPVQVLDIREDLVTLGGAGNVLKNLRSLGAQVELCSVLGVDETADRIISELEKLDVRTSGIVRDPGRVSTRKTRALSLEHSQQIFRMDRESRSPLDPPFEAALTERIAGAIQDADLVVVSDYAKGVLTETVLQTLLKLAFQAAKPVVVDPKARDFQRYRGATVLTPNLSEAEAASGLPIRSEADLAAAAQALLQAADTEAVLITRGAKGMSLFERSGAATHIPSVARELYDVTGAGDTVLAVLSLGIASGLPRPEAARLANLAAGIVVGRIGTAVLTRDELLTAARNSAAVSGAKVVSLTALLGRVEKARTAGKRIVFTNGCFDLLHVGHVTCLERARQMGDLLIVGLNSDESVRRLKGLARPINSELDRAMLIAALSCVDYVTIFADDTPIQLIESICPDVLVKGADWGADNVAGGDLVRARGGQVVLVDLVGGRSTTELIHAIQSRAEAAVGNERR